MKPAKSTVFLDVNTRVVAASDQVSTRLDDEVVILSLGSGQYYSLRNVGARIWELIREPLTVAQIRDAIVRQYGVEPDVVEADVLEFCQRMADLGLVERIRPELGLTR